MMSSQIMDSERAQGWDSVPAHRPCFTAHDPGSPQILTSPEPCDLYSLFPDAQ
jgi:hypothetical protein